MEPTGNKAPAFDSRRAIDVVGAAVLLAISLPLLAGCALAVLVESGRPVFFGHIRLGRGGRRFRCWKLRTMRAGAEEALDRMPALKQRYIDNGYKLPAADDPRVTRVGRGLRRWHLDELPQLYNVLTGTMSLIGPRPIVPDELAQYEPDAHELLRITPGITGAWTSLGWQRPDYPERARIELEYVRSRRLGTDVTILLRSAAAVLRGAPDA